MNNWELRWGKQLSFSPLCAWWNEPNSTKTLDEISCQTFWIKAMWLTWGELNGPQQGIKASERKEVELVLNYAHPQNLIPQANYCSFSIACVWGYVDNWDILSNEDKMAAAPDTTETIRSILRYRTKNNNATRRGAISHPFGWPL